MVRRSPHSIGKTIRAPTVAPADSSTGSLLKDGFVWGLGNGLAHTLVNSVFRSVTVGSAVSAVPAVPVPTTGSSQASVEYAQCMKDFDDPVACRSLLPK